MGKGKEDRTLTLLYGVDRTRQFGPSPSHRLYSREDEVAAENVSAFFTSLEQDIYISQKFLCVSVRKP